ncbi:hypothetical protein LEMLEM_LOCUS21546, partial [Lemmus lemmus]
CFIPPRSQDIEFCGLQLGRQYFRRLVIRNIICFFRNTLARSPSTAQASGAQGRWSLPPLGASCSLGQPRPATAT